MKTELKPYPGTKKLFWKLGACSTTLFHILDREFGHAPGVEGIAALPLAGGILGKGHQCGALWGATLAAGAEAFRRSPDRGRAVALAVTATQSLVDSFTERMGTVSCREITRCNWMNPFSIVKYMISGGIPLCFNLVDQWAPEAFAAADEALTRASASPLPANATSSQAISCATEVAKQMGAGDEEATTVAGFAGGIGLSGHACGALAAAIWMHTLAWCREHPGKNPPMFKNPKLENIFQAFMDATNGEILCQKISGQLFKTVDEHTEFIKNGGCDKLMHVLSHA